MSNHLGRYLAYSTCRQVRCQGTGCTICKHPPVTDLLKNLCFYFQFTSSNFSQGNLLQPNLMQPTPMMPQQNRNQMQMMGQTSMSQQNLMGGNIMMSSSQPVSQSTSTTPTSSPSVSPPLLTCIISIQKMHLSIRSFIILHFDFRIYCQGLCKSWFLNGNQVPHTRLSPLPKNFEYLPL